MFIGQINIISSQYFNICKVQFLYPTNEAQYEDKMYTRTTKNTFDMFQNNSK